MEETSLTWRTIRWVVKYRYLTVMQDAMQKPFYNEQCAIEFANKAKSKGYSVQLIREQDAEEYYH